MIRDRRVFLQVAAGCLAVPALAAWPATASPQGHHGNASQATAPSGNTLVFAAATLKPALDEVVSAFKSSAAQT